jgi:hypothetical protein
VPRRHERGERQLPPRPGLRRLRALHRQRPFRRSFRRPTVPNAPLRVWLDPCAGRSRRREGRRRHGRTSKNRASFGRRRLDNGLRLRSGARRRGVRIRVRGDDRR